MAWAEHPGGRPAGTAQAAASGCWTPVTGNDDRRPASPAPILRRSAVSLTGLFNVAPLDGLLRASGMAPVAG
ncbi:MAG: hypothetical protein JWM19_1766 [Actinomycetia bacterium]|nr:hypothetical protein [Actinomycetes bacterium]